MGRYTMPKRRSDFEEMLVEAFATGMNCGYAVEHTQLSEDEMVYINRYRAYIQGKISSMGEQYNNEKTYCERVAEGAEIDG